MTTTDEEYLTIADTAYDVDPRWGTPLPTTEFKSQYGHQQYVVLKDKVPPENEPTTGFQAIVVAPVVNGNPDTSHVIVSFAGTNPSDSADLDADAESVVAGKTGPGSQVAQAQAFAAEVKSKYSTSTISVTGHSLGGFLALDVAAENHWPATTFNGPDPSGVLSPQAKAWQQAQEASGQRQAKILVGYEGVLV